MKESEEKDYILSRSSFLFEFGGTCGIFLRKVSFLDFLTLLRRPPDFSRSPQNQTEQIMRWPVFSCFFTVFLERTILKTDNPWGGTKDTTVLAGKPGLFLFQNVLLFIIFYFSFSFEGKESHVQPSAEFCTRV